MAADEPIDALTRSVLEGTEVDWPLAEEEAERALARVRALRAVAQIAAFHRALQRNLDEEGAPLPESDLRISPPRPRPR